MEAICPRCLISKPSISSVPEDMRQKFMALQLGLDLPDEMCVNCMDDVRALVSSNSTALDREVSKEDKKAKLWRGRVTLIKRARAAMKKKSYGAAVKSYEKYIKSLEVVFDVTEEGLTPDLFRERMATKELTLVTSAYWDMLRVYDTSEKYRPRMLKTATKLVQFARVTPILLDIVKKTEAYKKQAKNPEVFKKILTDLMYQKNYCFIATSVFSEPQYWNEIAQLRQFRDEVLLKYAWGRSFVKLYYRYSPPWAQYLDRHEKLKPYVRFFLLRVTKSLQTNTEL